MCVSEGKKYFSGSFSGNFAYVLNEQKSTNEDFVVEVEKIRVSLSRMKN